MAYARTSLRGEKRAVRERMRSVGMGYGQIAAEFARVYRLRPRSAWREAYGWTLQEAADRINTHRAHTGLDAHGICGMTSAHLCEYENWPGCGEVPTGRRPSPALLAVLAGIYDCRVDDLIDYADRLNFGAADLLVIDTYLRPADRPSCDTQEDDAALIGTGRHGPALARSCSRCGQRLSRYNTDDYCGGCAKPAAHDGRQAENTDIAEMGARLHASRLRRGMTLEVLAGLAGVSQAYLSMVENGKRRLDSYSRIMTLADALRVLPGEIAPGLAVKRARLAARRRAVGLSQEQLADSLRVDRSTIGRWESGEAEPQPWTRPRLARLLKVSVDQLDDLLAEAGPAPSAEIYPMPRREIGVAG